MALKIQHSLEDLVENFTPGGCYGIVWGLNSSKLVKKSHYNPQWRIDEAKAHGWDSFYTEQSGAYEFAVGEGVVGKAFQSQEVLFVEDLQDIDVEGVKSTLFMGDIGGVYLRADLAKKFGLHSAIFLPTADSVFEIGSGCIMKSLPQFYVPYMGKRTLGMAVPSETCVSEVQVEWKKQISGNPSEMLQKLVESQSMCCYGIEWVSTEKGLVHKSHYNAKWRIEAVERKCSEGYYTAHSATYTFAEGEGLVGNAFAEQAVVFASDLQAFSSEDAKADFSRQCSIRFLRAELARQFGIHSAIFLPTPETVLELGTTQKKSCLEDMFSEPAKAAIAGKSNPSDILNALLGYAS